MDWFIQGAFLGHSKEELRTINSSGEIGRAVSIEQSARHAGLERRARLHVDSHQLSIRR